VTTRDGGLSHLFINKIPGHWQSVETWSTGRGVPDLNGCTDGVEFWVELKGTATNRVDLWPEQIGWLERRSRAGGRCFVAVRFRCLPGPRRVAQDTLFLFRGADARWLLKEGLRGPQPLGQWSQPWDWDAVRALLVG